ncbi:MAG TPA: response regulator, partial [Planctomycetota bacterium]
PARPRRVFLAADSETAARVVEALRPFGYDVAPFDDLGALIAAMDVEPPLAAALGASIAPSAAFLDALRARGVPLFCLSKDGGLEARIAAARAGARGFADAATLAEGLDRLALDPRAEPHRVMIVDDDPAAARARAAPLRRSGMTVATVTDPARALDALLRFQPDLLLLDLDLGAFPGDELAAAVRQHPACVGLPIVCLSSEARAAFPFAESVLLKPVPPARLLAETLPRAERGRALRTRLLFDGPAGDLQPADFLRRLRGETDLARRRGRSLCCAEARIDGFAALDEPRRSSVPRLLHDLVRARLRSSDAVGRSGPDGVTIALPDVDARAAARILEDLRRACDESERATLSAGAAIFPAVADGGLLLDTARQARARAADAGGNRVVILPSDSVV